MTVSAIFSNYLWNQREFQHSETLFGSKVPEADIMHWLDGGRGFIFFSSVNTSLKHCNFVNDLYILASVLFTPWSYSWFFSVLRNIYSHRLKDEFMFLLGRANYDFN